MDLDLAAAIAHAKAQAAIADAKRAAKARSRLVDILEAAGLPTQNDEWAGGYAILGGAILVRKNGALFFDAYDDSNANIGFFDDPERLLAIVAKLTPPEAPQ